MEKPLAFKTEACPNGYQVSWSRGDGQWSSKRTKTMLGAKYYIWAYKRRIRKIEQV